MFPEILFEDNHLIAVLKRSGQTVQPEPGKPESLEEETKAYIKHTYQKPGAVYLGVIHRLDMPVSGIVLFARTSKSLTRMNVSFRDREISKRYRCIVEGKPPAASGRLVHYLKRDEKKNFTKAFESPVKDGLESSLRYEVLQSQGKKTLLQIDLETGRKHQIRVQLSAMGCPIVGDYKYGASKPLADHSIQLQAIELEFKHPVKDEMIQLSLKNSKYLLKL
ncbi:RNA pseudouridine synthase [Bacteroidota bacterium]